jgi:gluconolactonase
MSAVCLGPMESFGQGVVGSEGVVIDRYNNVYGAGKGGVVYEVAPDGTVGTVCTLPNGAVPLGLTMDRKGNIICCDAGNHGVIKIGRDGNVSAVADRVGSIDLMMPNFVAYDADENLYISNSTTRDISVAGSELATPEPNGALVCIRNNGNHEVVATNLYFANGVAIDPTEEAIYVVQTTQRNCLRISIKKDGSFSKPEIYSSGFPAIPDGIAFATDGTLIVTLPAAFANHRLSSARQVITVDTQGNWTPFIHDESGKKLNFPSNCAFGGDGLQDLYLANLEGDCFTRVRTTLCGHPLLHQR